MCYRFIPLSQAIFAAYRRGDLGDVFLADGNYRSGLGKLKEVTPWRFDPKQPQDILLGGACHPIDMLRWVMDVTVEEVHGYANHLSEPLYTIDDCYSVHCRFSNGAIGRLCAMSGARAHTPDSSGVTFWGTKGTVWDGRLHADGRPEPLDLRQEAPTLRYPVQSSFGLPWGDELAHFVECVREDRPPIVDVVHGAQTIAALCAGIEFGTDREAGAAAAGVLTRGGGEGLNTEEHGDTKAGRSRAMGGGLAPEHSSCRTGRKSVYGSIIVVNSAKVQVLHLRCGTCSRTTPLPSAVQERPVEGQCPSLGRSSGECRALTNDHSP